MSIKSLFEESKAIQTNSSLDEFTSSIESTGLIVAANSYKKKNFPNINFSIPDNFAKFGLAKEYYNNSFSRTYNTFPYDGSQKEIIEWHISSSYVDDYIYENIYPKSRGCIYFDTNIGSLTDTVSSIFKKYTNTRYIQMSQSGINVDNIYLSSTRDINLGFYPEDGFTVQFWMKKKSFKNAADSSVYENVVSLWTNSGSTGNPLNILNASIQGYNYSELSVDFSLGAQNQTGWSFLLNFNLDNGQWNHYTIVIAYTSSLGHAAKANLWVNGNKTNEDIEVLESGLLLGRLISLTGTIGSVCSSSLSHGYNPLVDTYIDDFRFWKRALTEEEIKKNWYCNVYGGTNSDNEVISSSLGIYYKFNEGITQTASIDANILDYSGRNTNGYFIGYSSSFRNTGSAYIDYGLYEQQDPIIYNFHTDVLYTQSYYSDIGQEYDNKNGNSFLNLFPQHIQDEDYDTNQDLMKLSHIVGSKFDEIFLEISELTKVRNVNYLESGSYNFEVASRLLESHGLLVSDIFSTISENEYFNNKDERIIFERNIEKIKSHIYKNIYNNLLSIYKSKGTQESFRNVFRSFGVDDDLLKIKIYSDKEKFKITNNRNIALRKKKFLDLSGLDNYNNINCNVFPYVLNENIGDEIAYIPFNTNENDSGGLCFETTINFPKFDNELDLFYRQIPESYTSASLFGLIPVGYYLEGNGTWFQNTNETNTEKYDGTFCSSSIIFVSKKEKNSSKAKFILRLSGGKGIKSAETEYLDVYSDTQWTLALQATRSSDLIFASYPNEYTNCLFLYGNKVAGGEIVDSFVISATIDQNTFEGYPNFTISQWMAMDKKPFIGAYRRNFTGSVVYPTLAKFISSKIYVNTFDVEVLKNHAIDVFNYGIISSSRPFNIINNVGENNNTVYGTGIPQLYLPNYMTPIMVWDFENITGSNSNGNLYVESLISGTSYLHNSISDESDYAYHFDKKITGKGYGFIANDDSMIDNNYVVVGKNREVGDFNGSDFVQIDDDESYYFNKQKHPSKFYYTIENSMYSVINEEILNLFHSTEEFNDLIGNEYEKYRHSYKSLEKIREFFFSKLNNVKKVDSYLRYYKWFDNSISEIIRQIIPASMNSSQGILNVIESHILERNKVKYYESFIKTKEYNFDGRIINTAAMQNQWAESQRGEKIGKFTWKAQEQNGRYPQKILKIR